ncbi:unnamed protein product [Nyctereutes procyonoides]|uniref:Vomeronasal type-1 receptor n=1 Tax=Nyctereutes procyonoides TaxID=34880 RepID=A0A811ZTD3_NYCPR|nr:unnamed protein product [Nyctereutes procyonoides]
MSSFTIMFRLIPNVMSSFGMTNFPDDVECKAMLYTYRVSQGLPISMTSLLSALQTITISSSNSRWVWLKSKISTCRAPGSAVVVLMVWSGIYMVNLLCRHHKRAQHVHSPSLSSQPPPEIKATHSALLLVSCFVFFYCSGNCLTIYLASGPEENPRLERIAGSVSSCYLTICPFVLMESNKIISKFISALSKVRITSSQRAFSDSPDTPPLHSNAEESTLSFI